MHMTIVALKKPVITLPKAYKNYTDVFNKEKAELLPDYSPHELAIELIKDKQPLFSPLYNLLKAKLRVLKEYLAKNL